MPALFYPTLTRDPAITTLDKGLAPMIDRVIASATHLREELHAFGLTVSLLGSDGSALRAQIQHWLGVTTGLVPIEGRDTTAIQDVLAELLRPKGPMLLLGYAMGRSERLAELDRCTDTEVFFRLDFATVERFSLETGRNLDTLPEHGLNALIVPQKTLKQVRKLMRPWLAKQKAAKAKRPGKQAVSRGHVR